MKLGTDAPRWGSWLTLFAARKDEPPCLVPLQVVANLSACGEVDSEALVRCLQGKSEEKILAITKVGLNNLECR